MRPTAAALVVVLAVVLAVVSPWRSPSLHAEGLSPSAAWHVETVAAPARARGAVVAGWVVNDREMRMEHVRLRLEQDGGPVTWRWVSGSIGPRERRYFEFPVPADASYRVQVESFDWAACGNG